MLPSGRETFSFPKTEIPCCNGIMNDMERIEKDAFFSVHTRLTLSKTDEEVLSLLYLPIVKGPAYALYHHLLSLARLEESGYERFDELCGDMELEEFSLLQAFCRLEAIGLLESYRREQNGIVYYILVPFPPATPKKFFADVALSHLLAQNLGGKRFQRIRFSFSEGERMPLGYQRTTTAFSDVYALEPNPAAECGSDEIEEKKYQSVVQFDWNDMLSLLEATEQRAVTSSKDPIVELSTLYGISEGDAAELIRKNIDTAGTFYIEGFRKDVRQYHRFQGPASPARPGSGSGSKNRLAKQLEELTPQRYLANRLETSPAPFMLDFVEHLSHDLGMSNPLINAALEYSFRKTKGRFVDSYIEKVCYTLKANKVRTSYDALVLLMEQDYDKKSTTRKTKKIEKIEDETTSEDEERISALEEELRI